MKYKLLIFDWDGTLSDSHSAVVACMQHTANELQLPCPTPESIRTAYGLPLDKMIEKIFVNVESQLFATKFYENIIHYRDQEQLFHDAMQTLQYLQQKKYLMAIATNKERKELLFALDNFNLHNYFCAIRCGDDGFVKPQPEVLLNLLDELSVKPQNAVMIGDSIYDMQVAQRANVDAIGISCEASRKQELLQHKPIVCVNSLTELQKFLAPDTDL